MAIPVWTRDTLKRRQALRLVLAAHSILWGSIYLFGPDRVKSSPTLVWVDGLFWGLVPIEAWGVVAILLGFSFLTRWRVYGHGIAHVFWAAWTMCLLAAAFTVDGASGAGWLHVAWLALSHLQFTLYEDDDVPTLDFSAWSRADWRWSA